MTGGATVRSNFNTARIGSQDVSLDCNTGGKNCPAKIPMGQVRLPECNDILVRGPIAIVLNTSATNATRHNLCSEIEKRFASRNITARLLITRTAAELPQLAANAASQAVEAVIAAGGDGTVSTIAGSLAHGSIPLGILPLGNLNHFAKDLRIPLDLESAIDTITAGKTTPVDIASVNGIHFVNNSSLGLYPMIVRYREMQQRRGLRKWQAFVRAVLIAFRRYPFFQVQVTMNGQTLVRATPFAFVGNNMYQVEGLRIGSRSSLTGGLLCLYIVHGLGRL